MTLKEIITLLIETDKRPSYKFERIVLAVLEKYVADQNKNIHIGARFADLNSEADAVISDSLFYPGNLTVVEIKLFRNSLITLHRQSLIQFATKFKSIHTDNLDYLFIVSGEMKKNEKDRHLNSLKNEFPRMKFNIWDLTDLAPIFNKYAEYVTDLIPQIGEKAIKNIVSKSLEQNDWKKEREKLINKLNEAHKKDDLTLLVGAGVSASAGLPDWNSLLSQLLINLITKNLPSDIEVNPTETLILANSLQQLNSSPLLEARYVNSGLGDNFEKNIATVLYRDISDDTTSELIKSIANMCIPPRGSLGVRAIINYNFDDLIEKELHKMGLKYRPIYRDVDIPEKEELGIFHVHGFLPRETSAYDGISESLLVFSEKNYHTLMQDPYFWSNLIQLNFFRENTCLLIGLSGTDPNLRRLLEIAKRKTKFAKHYILLRRTPNDFFSANFQKENLSNNQNLVNAINSIHHNLHERSFEELGLNVIWYEDYEELPQLLSQINER